ncbi:MAG: hypothetical protein L3J98_00870 [Gammaproteobacteria bacterium]|nr:hypothetical protein [Gammaproteobacteria bacterium]MCF6258707.1 hypothetical protein [Gammaproteobacteria bacterium]
MKKFTKYFIIKAIPVLGILLLTACGGGGGNSNDNPAEESSDWNSMVWNQGKWK